MNAFAQPLMLGGENLADFGKVKSVPDRQVRKSTANDTELAKK